MAAGKHLTSGATSDYQDYRDALREKERTDAWDYVRKACITAEERHASEIMKALREYERRKIFGNVASEDLPGEDTLDMGGQFLTNKARITTMSVVFKIAQDVPKGALLHGHYYNGEPIESLLQKAREAKDFYIWSKYPLRSEHDLERTEVVFRVLSCDAVDKGVDIFSRKYEGTGDNWKSRTMTPRVWMQWQKFCEKFEKRFKKNSPAEHWLKTKMVLSEEETYGINQTLNG
jgi:adenosine deaminase CECR1